MIESYCKVARKKERKNVEQRATQKVVSQVYLNMDEINFIFLEINLTYLQIFIYVYIVSIYLILNKKNGIFLKLINPKQT